MKKREWEILSRFLLLRDVFFHIFAYCPFANDRKSGNIYL